MRTAPKDLLDFKDESTKYLEDTFRYIPSAIGGLKSRISAKKFEIIELTYFTYSSIYRDHMARAEKELQELRGDLSYQKKLYRSIQVELADRGDSVWRVKDDAIRKKLKL